MRVSDGEKLVTVACTPGEEDEDNADENVTDTPETDSDDTNA